MRRTVVLFALALVSLAAAAVAALLRPAAPKPVPPRPPAAAAGTAGMRIGALLDRLYLSEDRPTSAYLQIDVEADAGRPDRGRVPVNAVLIIDRSGSMSGLKIVRARDAARALAQALGPDDRLSVVEFSSAASVLVESTPVTPQARARALEAIDAIEPMGGTNMSAAFSAAAPQLARGAAPGRADKVFLASDGRANEGVSERSALLRFARQALPEAALSTFGIGNDYDEDLMSALAEQAGGRARYIDSPGILAGAFEAELSRASSLVARDVRVRVTGLSGSSVQGILGFEPDSGWVRLPDFAAGEARHVFARLSIPPGRALQDIASIELAFTGVDGERRKAATVARATFTADASLLGQPATAAAAAGAKAEMAQLAGQAARLQEAGEAGAARNKLATLGEVAAQAVLAAPASAAEVKQFAEEYERGVAGIARDASTAASKRVKQKVFDDLRAPVSGW